jgi:hypothetical protein
MPLRLVDLRAGLRVLALSMALLAVADRAQPQVPVVREYDAKAGFLTAFTKYVTWPANALAPQSSPVLICILGSDPFGDVLDRTAALTRNGRPLQVRRIRLIDDAVKCHVVFIARSESRNETEWIAALRNKPILTVGESGRTLERGGDVEFTTTRDQVRFDVNLTAARQAGLILSSDLLSHAGKVRQ